MNISYEYSSPNYGDRKGDATIDTIVLHSIAYDLKKSINILTSEEYQVSSHYLVDVDGTIYALVGEEKRAWHAGKSFWRGETDVNSHSIGIEIITDESNEFTDAQKQAVIELCAEIKSRHASIDDRNIIGHSDIAPGRKVDPGSNFFWKDLADNGLGMWYNVDENDHESMFFLGDRSTQIYDIKHKLSDLGYYIQNLDDAYDTDLKTVLYSFQMHFDEANVTGNIDKTTIAIIDDLYNHYVI